MGRAQAGGCTIEKGVLRGPIVRAEDRRRRWEAEAGRLEYGKELFESLRRCGPGISIQPGSFRTYQETHRQIGSDRVLWGVRS